MKGVLLETMTWQQAEQHLTPQSVVVMALGAAAKEHGPHLQLNNDWLIAEYYKQRVQEAAEVVVAPTINHHHYPAFAEYPGSVSLRLSTARDLLVDICASLAAYGPRRFYVLNTGVSTVKPLELAAELLAGRGILLRFARLSATKALSRALSQQEGGSHADEMETSMMLYIAPETVDMSKAVKDYDPRPLPGMTRQGPDAGKTYSPSGVWGDATFATRAKGQALVEARLQHMLEDIQALRTAPLPPSTAPSPPVKR